MNFSKTLTLAFLASTALTACGRSTETQTNDRYGPTQVQPIPSVAHHTSFRPTIDIQCENDRLMPGENRKDPQVALRLARDRHDRLLKGDADRCVGTIKLFSKG